MPSEVFWLIEGEIIIIRNQGSDANDENFLELDALVCSMLDQATKPKVHIVFDDQLMQVPPKLNEVTKAKGLRHKHLGWVVFTHTGPMVKMLVGIVRWIASAKIHYADNVDEALAVLVQKDDTLPNLETLKTIWAGKFTEV